MTSNVTVTMPIAVKVTVPTADHVADNARASHRRPPPVLLSAEQAAMTANHPQAFVFANVRPQAHRDQLHVLVHSNTALRRRLVAMAAVL